MPTPRGGGWRRLGTALAAVVLLVPHIMSAQQPCFGDCNNDGSVVVNEIIIALNVALGTAESSACGAPLCEEPPVDVACLVGIVNNALTGCPAGPPTTAGIVFNGEGNRLHAYDPGGTFPQQTVIPSNSDAPGTGRDINGQICFTRGPEGQVRFIAGEDTNQQQGHAVAGWGLFELTGDAVGSFHYQQLGKLIPTYQPAADDAENYGCGFLRDGRLLTTDVGSQASGPGTGQLIIWFPPFTTDTTYTPTGVLPVHPAHYCKLDIAIGTAQQIAIDSQDRIYVASARPNGKGDPGGIYRYTGPFPTSDQPDGGCDGMDGEGSPMATHVTKELFIPTDSDVVTPAGIAVKRDGNFYVSSVLNGVIAEYDNGGRFVGRILEPPAPGFPIATGTPLGIAVASDGTVYYADIGLTIGPGGIGPGNNNGTVRRLRFLNGQPLEPETMGTGLDFPDGIGILELDAQ